MKMIVFSISICNLSAAMIVEALHALDSLGRSDALRIRGGAFYCEEETPQPPSCEECERIGELLRYRKCSTEPIDNGTCEAYWDEECHSCTQVSDVDCGGIYKIYSDDQCSVFIENSNACLRDYDSATGKDHGGWCPDECPEN